MNVVNIMNDWFIMMIYINLSNSMILYHICVIIWMIYDFWIMKFVLWYIDWIDYDGCYFDELKIDFLFDVIYDNWYD